MAAKPPKYNPGWKGSLELDGTPQPIMGWSSSDSVDENDVSVNTDNGWSATEAGLRSVSINFSFPMKATDTAPPITTGGIYPCLFEINGNPQYDGDFLITSCNLDSPIRGVAMYQCTAKNYGDVSVDPTP